MPDSNSSCNLIDALKISDDGFIMLSSDGVILDINEQAHRIIGGGSSTVINQSLDLVIGKSPNWSNLLASIELGQRSETVVHLSPGRKVLVSLRRGRNSSHVELLQLCELDAFDYKRNTASGTNNTGNNGFLTSNKTRPDFEVQRRFSPKLHRILSRGERAVQQGARVLIVGETGVGKTEIAKFLHNSVSDATAPFVVVNCAMSSADDLAEQLFGSNDCNSGLVSKATGGTLFLDEVAEIPLSVQARLVGYLENTLSVGTGIGSTLIPSIRIMSATNADLNQRVKDKLFRTDLYYRLSVIELYVPPLRQLPSLIHHLTERFLMTINQRRTTPVIISERFRNALEDYSFPGNIRELLNIVQKASIFMEDAQDMEELINELLVASSADVAKDESRIDPIVELKAQVRRFERAIIDKAILVHGSKRKAAKALGVDIGTISRKTSEKLTSTKNDLTKTIRNPYNKETGVTK